jgi:O-glycosyl hydrolase
MKGELSSICSAFENPNGERVVIVANQYNDTKVITLEGKSYTLPPKSVSTIVID